MRNVLLRVYDAAGRPVQGARVALWIYQFAAGGSVPEKHTNNEGRAEFDLDVDEFAEISISVNGSEKVRRGRIQGSYRIDI